MSDEKSGAKPQTRGAFSRVRGALSNLAKATWWRTPRFLIGAILVTGIVGAGAGYVIAKSPLPHYVRETLIDRGLSSLRHAMGQADEARWELYETHQGPFQILRVPVARPGDGAMAALEELDGHLLFLTQHGTMISLGRSNNELHELAVTPPMNTEALHAANIPGINYTFFRALDLLAIQTAPQAYDLYVSYNKFNAAETCFQIAFARIRMTTDENGIRPASDWEELFATQPCVSPRITQDVFIGIQSGGRLIRYDDHTILLSTGDLEFDGVNYPGMEDALNGPQNPQWDLGKIISFDLATNRATHFAMGFRNPQGLLLDRSGRLWETEHGPFGGDEINLVRRGGNYGWPNVTYGFRYQPIRDNWPLNPTHGGHEGYDRPAQVFVPSIGISNLIQPSVETFPFWDNSLLLLSLRAHALHAVRLDGDRIAYVEPLPMGDRLRDIINRANGEVAILTDTGSLIRMRPLDDGQVSQDVYAVLDQRAEDEDAPRATPAEAGRQLFASQCSSCHNLTGRAGAGPPLNGVVGRDIASADFSYSPALQGVNGNWTGQRLASFLTEPQRQFSGTTMPNPQLTPEQARQITAYLRTTEE